MSSISRELFVCHTKASKRTIANKQTHLTKPEQTTVNHRPYSAGGSVDCFRALAKVWPGDERGAREARDGMGRNALMLAARFGRKEMCRYLLDSGKTGVMAAGEFDTNGESPLFAAVKVRETGGGRGSMWGLVAGEAVYSWRLYCAFIRMSTISDTDPWWRRHAKPLTLNPKLQTLNPEPEI